MLFMYIIVTFVKKLLISGGGQLLGNDDGIKIAGVWVPAGNSYRVISMYGLRDTDF